MTLLDAKEYHPEQERKRRTRIVSAILLVLVLAFVGWWKRFWPEERVADQFFSALQKQDFETAYGIYYHDPAWKQHAQSHAQYAFHEFWQDWGPGGQWGAIKSFKIYGSSNCPGGGSGVVVDLIVNDRSQHAQLYVDKTDKTVSTPPCDLEFR
ncbi:MAG: hypothetical protein ABSF59_19380 [Candidatus Sulfotelmatobacter sp.]|jgi:hypothetical protein